MSEEKSKGPKVYFPQNKTEAEAMIRSIDDRMEFEETGKVTNRK